MKKTTEDIVIQWFQQVSEDLAGKWNSVLTYDEILREAYYLYSLKPDTWKLAYIESPHSIRSYLYTALDNHIVTNTAPDKTKWMRFNYMCDEGMMDEVVSGRLRLDAIYQPTLKELRQDIRSIMEGEAPNYLQEAWMKITAGQRRLLKEFALRDDAITRHERKASTKFIMRVI